MSGFPAWESNQGTWSSRNMARRVNGILLKEFQKTEESRNSSLGAHKQNFACTKTQRRGTVTL